LIAVAAQVPPAGSGEDRLIETFFRPLARDAGALGLIDDAAILTPPAGHDLVLTTDAIVAGVHFFPDDPPETIGRKALRVNLSDLAAKGAKPAGFLMSLGLPAGIGDEWLTAYAHGLGADVEIYQCPLLGGDTVKSPVVMVSIAAFGILPGGTMARRSGAKPGDVVLVTGTIGDAALGLRLRQDRQLHRRFDLAESEAGELLARYLVPEPRTGLAEAVRRHAGGAMDVSDGLAGDLAKLCRASGVSAEIEIAKVPLSQPARRMVAVDSGLLETVLTGGDDYEIVCTMPAPRADAFRGAAAAASLPVHEIGRIVAGEAAPRFLDHRGQPLAFVHPSFSHF
jgi:thiamine-monophosphate kinase